MTSKKKKILAGTGIVTILLSLALSNIRNLISQRLEKVFVSYFPMNIIGLAVLVGVYLIIRHARNVGPTWLKLPTSFSRNKKILALVLLAALLGTVTIITMIYGHEDKGVVQQVKPNPTTDNVQVDTVPAVPKPKEIPISPGRKTLGIVILVAFFAGLLWRLGYQKWGSPKMPWAEIGKQPMMLTIYLLVLFWLIVTFLIPEFWEFMWGDQALFWSFNMVTVTIVSLLLLKNAGGQQLPTAKFGAYVLLGVFVIGTIRQIAYNRNWSWPSSTDASNSTWPRTSAENVTNKKYMFGPEQVPVATALQIIGSCESLGHPNGTPVHYESDGNTLLKNKEGSPARGKYQMMPDHWEMAKKMGPPLNLEIEKDYDAYAVDLYNRTGTQHWEFDAHKGQGPACWGPKLLALGYKMNSEQPEQVLMVKAPIEGSYDVAIPIGTYFKWSSADAFVVEDQKGAKAVYNPDIGVIQNLQYPSTILKFRSLRDKPAEIKLTLSDKPLVAIR